MYVDLILNNTVTSCHDLPNHSATDDTVNQVVFLKHIEPP